MTELPKTAIYLDANVFIYAVEGPDSVALPVKELLAHFRKNPGTAVTSELTLAEVLPKATLPMHRRSYLDLMVWGGMVQLWPVTREILIETADYRRVSATVLPGGRTVMAKLPDAIHVVSAIRSGCQRIVSADGGLRVPKGMTVVPPSSSGILKLLEELS